MADKHPDGGCSDRMKETLLSLLVLVVCGDSPPACQHHNHHPTRPALTFPLVNPVTHPYVPTTHIQRGDGGRFLTRTAYRFCMTIYARVPCPACQHAMRYTRRDDRWTCTYCPMSISAQAGQSAMVQSTPVQEQPPISIDDLNIFQKQGTRVT